MYSGRIGSVFSDGRLTGFYFLEDDQRKDVATIHPFRVPVDDLFGFRIGDGVSALLGFDVPNLPACQRDRP